MSVRPRLAIVLSHATQYYSPWFRWLHAHTDLEFKVFYLDESGLSPVLDEKFKKTFAWDIDLTSGYDWELVENRASHPSTLRFFGLKNPALHARLADWGPHAILLFGYKYATHLRLIAWARWHRIPLIFRGDSHLLGRAPSALKRHLIGTVYRQFEAITYVGAANRDYFQHHGIGAEKLFFAPHAVNARHFDGSSDEHRRRSLALRVELGLDADTRVLLFAGKLIAEKNPRMLLEAFLVLDRPKVALVFLGDGPEKPTLLSRAAETPEANLQFLPFANQSEMPSRYLLADLLVLPSGSVFETWGLVVNEAMHMGVPCVVSDRVGCQRDLVISGQTGWVFPAGDAMALTAVLRQALDSLATEGDAIRQRVSQRIRGYTYEHTSAGLIQALHHVLPAVATSSAGAPR